MCLVKRGGLEMKNLVVLTGAGMSAESGISTFRDAGGLWDQYPVEQVATPICFPPPAFGLPQIGRASCRERVQAIV